MTEKSSSPRAGGVALAICSIAGVMIGSYNGQPSLGFIGGVGAGALIAIAIWLWDRRH